jgi:amidohydrolase
MRSIILRFYNPTVTSADARIERLFADFPREELDRLIQTRRDFHRHPELAYEERRTGEVVAERLRALRLAPRTGLAGTGVAADAGAAKGPRLMLRADMDALPIQEQNGAPYASESPGRMHACGHDGHMAIGLAVAERLVRRPPAAALRFLYQPAEEGRGGAQACTDQGALDGVTAAFGLHLWSPLPVGRIGVNRGALMAAVDNFTIDIEGRGGHGASPHEAADPILAAARVVEALQSVVSREVSPLDSAVVTIGSIHGGTAFNVIPSAVQLQGTARSFTEITGRALPQKIRRIVEGTAAACGVSATIRYERTNGATVNDPRMADIVIDAAREILGEENVETDTRTLGGEDMSVYLERVPGCFFFVGCAREGALRPHHSPVFDIDERALAVGTVVLEAVARRAAERLAAG